MVVGEVFQVLDYHCLKYSVIFTQDIVAEQMQQYTLSELSSLLPVE